MPVTEEELHAYVDGELSPERHAAVEAWLAAHPEDAARVASWQSLNLDLRERYAALTDMPIPGALAIPPAPPARRFWLAAAAAVVLAFAGGVAAGWFARPDQVAASPAQQFITEALDAHRLYSVEVRHPVEVWSGERAHMLQWLSKRLSYDVQAPDLDGIGLKLVGGRLLPGPQSPAAFLIYENASGDRFSIFCARYNTEAAHMRFRNDERFAAVFWADRNIGYTLSGPPDRPRLQAVAQLVYEQVDRPAQADQKPEK